MKGKDALIIQKKYKCGEGKKILAQGEGGTQRSNLAEPVYCNKWANIVVKTRISKDKLFFSINIGNPLDLFNFAPLKQFFHDFFYF